jgi:hypothetical protein
MGGWVDGWMGGWIEVKAILRIAYSNKKLDYLTTRALKHNTMND